MKEEKSNKYNLPIQNRMYTYTDMVEAFKAGVKHHMECGRTNSDCWDFVTWMKEQYMRNQ